MTVVSVKNQPSFIPVYFPLKEGQDFLITWHIEDEKGNINKYIKDGFDISGPKTIDGIRYVKVELQNETGREIGYYSLTVKCKTPDNEHAGTMRLIVAPDRCYVPEGRAWGVSLNLYSLRSERNWGIGDLGDLKDTINYVNKLGGGFVGINPLHAIPNRTPYGISPYAPITRLYRNFIYIDIKSAFKRLNIRMAAKGLKDKIEQLQDSELIDYEKAASLKMDILKNAFSRFDHDSSDDFLAYVNPRYFNFMFL